MSDARFATPHKRLKPITHRPILSFPRNFVFHEWRINEVTMKGKAMKIPKQQYTTEFKELAVQRVKDGMTAGAAVKEFGLVEQTLRNWVKTASAGTLNNGPDTLNHDEALAGLPPATYRANLKARSSPLKLSP